MSVFCVDKQESIFSGVCCLVF